MKSILIFDVDTQRDLIAPKGALHVPGAERMIPKIRRIFEFARENEVFVLSTVDSHQTDDPEFKSLSPHCLAGSDGQKKIDETLLNRPLILENRLQDRNLLEAIQRNRQIIIEKQEFDPFSNPVTEKILRAFPWRAIVFGVPLELAVRPACLGLRKMGIKTAVLTDAVRALDHSAGEAAVAEMRKAGVEFITLDMLLGLQTP